MPQDGQSRSLLGLIPPAWEDGCQGSASAFPGRM